MSPDVNEFLGRVRTAYGPDPEAKARVRSALVAGAVLSSSAVAHAAAHTTVAKVGFGAKFGGLRLLLGGLASTSVVVGILASSGWSAPWVEPVPVRVSVHLHELGTVGEGLRHASSSGVEAPVTVITPIELAADESVVQPSSALPKPAHDTAVVPDSPSGQLLAELRLVRGATQSLRDGDVGTARQRLDEHRSRFPSGKLALERRGLYVLVQCAGGKTERAKEAARAYLDSAPSSPLASHVRQDCLE